MAMKDCQIEQFRYLPILQLVLKLLQNMSAVIKTNYSIRVSESKRSEC